MWAELTKWKQFKYVKYFFLISFNNFSFIYSCLNGGDYLYDSLDVTVQVICCCNIRERKGVEVSLKKEVVIHSHEDNGSIWNLHFT